MKTYFIIFAFIITALLSEGCSTRNSFDYKVTIEPVTLNPAATLAAMNETAGVISKRLVNRFSIPKEDIKPEVTANQISFTINNIDTAKLYQIRKVITASAKLEFRETYENSEILGSLTTADSILKDIKNVNKGEELKDSNSLFVILRPMISDKGEPLPSCMIGLVYEKDTAQVGRYLRMDQVKALFPKNIKYYWGARPYGYDPSKSMYGLFAIKVTTVDGKAPIDGNAIISANTVTREGYSGANVMLSMDSAGSRKWAVITRDNIERCIAVINNGRVLSYPRVMAEISGGKTEISGDFTTEEAEDLVSILNSGELPVKVKIVEDQLMKRE